jgi:hypothetical protein
VTTPPAWLEALGHVALSVGLLLTGTGIHALIRALDEHYGDASVAWLPRPRGVRVLVPKPRPVPPPARDASYPESGSRLRMFCGHAAAARHPLGGFRCPDCGAAAACLEGMGFKGGGYVTKGDRRR